MNQDYSTHTISVPLCYKKKERNMSETAPLKLAPPPQLNPPCPNMTHMLLPQKHDPTRGDVAFFWYNGGRRSSGEREPETWQPQGPLQAWW